MVEGCGGGTYLVLTAEGLWSQKMCRRTVQYVSSFCFSNVLAESFESFIKTRSSWLNCALRDEEAVYWVSIGHYKAVAVGT